LICVLMLSLILKLPGGKEIESGVRVKKENWNKDQQGDGNVHRTQPPTHSSCCGRVIAITSEINLKLII
jgi:hypothetical protein